jgi:hypothetical protein
VLCVGAPLGLQFPIAICIGLVAATFAPSVRRSIPRWLEIALWLALIFVCWLGVESIRDPRARELTASVNWAAGRILNTLLGLIGANVVDVLASIRFAIANAVVTLFGADLLALALLSSYREGRSWQPQVRLRDWMEFPVAAAHAPVPPESVPYAVDQLSERWAAATAVAGAAAATWSVQFLIWARDVGLPRTEERLALAVAVGRVETKVLLEAIRETSRELEAGARAGLAGQSPEVNNKLALKVAAILNGVSESQHRIAPVAGSLAQVIDIQALRIAQSLSRMGQPTAAREKAEEDGPDETNRLAS